MSNATLETDTEKILVKDGPSNMTLWEALIKRHPGNLPVFFLSFQEKSAAISAEVMSIAFDETKFQLFKLVCRIKGLSCKGEFCREKIKEGAEITIYYSIEKSCGYIE
jgi:hypothetical protein